eukprot:TRINITY_DN728_c0_g1_i6.p2 TRINITY_DN728_c0_g1~~TRINITY_DN728_c0_g1_i6.p2  ORF type:complete len:531 (+),score=198.29 TRINITY_DN728_c0_g1_i6:82-1593(+)
MAPRGAVLSAALWAAAAAGDKCEPTACVDGTCATECCAPTPLHHYPLNVSAWDPVGKRYQLLGRADAWYVWDETEGTDPLKDPTPKLGTFMHGPHFDRAHLDTDTPVPPTYVSATASGKVFLFDGFDAQMTTVNKKAVAWTDAPSTQYNIYDAQNRTTHMLVADGAPFWVAPAHHGWWLNRGGVHVVSTAAPHDSSQCAKIFPNKADDPKEISYGRVVNTVDCHQDTGFCFFSAWKFYGKTNSTFPDCLHWCLLDDPAAPTQCVLGGILTDEAGEKICHNSDTHVPPTAGVGGGGVHGFTIGRRTRGLDAELDLFLVYTGGPDAANRAAGCKDTFSCGASWVRKVAVRISRAAGDVAKSTIKVLSSAPWGRELWADTIADHTVADVGCDHAWMDASGKYVWVSTFRKQNDGMHMLDYETGALLFSIKGHESMRGWPTKPELEGGWYSYTAGCVGRGTMGQKGAMLSFATSQNYPLGMIPGGLHGKGGVFWVDISKQWVSPFRR